MKLLTKSQKKLLLFSIPEYLIGLLLFWLYYVMVTRPEGPGVGGLVIVLILQFVYFPYAVVYFLGCVFYALRKKGSSVSSVNYLIIYYAFLLGISPFFFGIW